MINLQFAKKAFDRYVSNFDMANEMIKLKYDHTFRVCEQSVNIARSLNLSDDDTNLVCLIALLHDIGRFTQEKEYNSFNDLKTVDHANLGCKILFIDGLINEFVLDRSYDDIIYKAIYNHNKYSISDDLNSIELLHSKIIRDADKIDIMNDVINVGMIKLNDDDSLVSTDINKDFFSHKSIDRKKVKTHNDSILIIFAFAYDLNYEYSYKYFKDNKFMDKFYDKLKNKDIFTLYKDEANEYIEGKCNDVNSKVCA